MTRYFDTHVHVDGIGSSVEADAALRRAAEAGVARMVAIGGDPARNRFAVEFAAKHPAHARAAVGADRDRAEISGGEDEVERLAADGQRVVAIGEIGLDYHYRSDNKPAQRGLFASMLAVARGSGLPVIVHSREAEDDTVALLKEHIGVRAPGRRGGIGALHCFTGGPGFCRRLLELDLYVSFSGIVTFGNARSVRDAARIVPADRLLVETDSPYLAPVPHRGARNEPALVVRVAAELAAVRGERAETIAETTFRNACRLFDWPAEE